MVIGATRCFPSRDYVNKYRNVIEPNWRMGPDKIATITDAEMARKRYDGVSLDAGGAYAYDLTVRRHDLLTHNELGSSLA